MVEVGLRLTERGALRVAEVERVFALWVYAEALKVGEAPEAVKEHEGVAHVKEVEVEVEVVNVMGEREGMEEGRVVPAPRRNCHFVCALSLQAAKV